MSVIRPTVIRAVAAVLALAAVALVVGEIDASFAQSGNPFGAGPPASRPPASPPDGIVGWLLAKQSEFYRALSGMIRAAKQDGTAVFGLLGLSFAYGIFHAAGPGHGKAVMSSYLVAN
jgi:nickel/cobalt exporter